MSGIKTNELDRIIGSTDDKHGNSYQRLETPLGTDLKYKQIATDPGIFEQSTSPEIARDELGRLTVTRRFEGDIVSILDRIKKAHTGDSYDTNMVFKSARARPKPGTNFGELITVYQTPEAGTTTAEGDQSLPEPVEYITGGAVEIPIEMHPDFSERKEYQGVNTPVVNGEEQPGLEAYLAPGVEAGRIEYSETFPGSAESEIEAIGTRETPGPKIPGTGANWLRIGYEVTQEGPKRYRIETRWKYAKGSPGWNPNIYEATA